MAELLPRCSSLAQRPGAADHRLHHRCRGGRPARALARYHRAAVAASPRSPAGTASALRSRPIGSAPARDRLARRPGATATGGGCRCGWSRAPIGTPRSSAPRSAARRLSGLHPQGRRPTSPISPARRTCCWRAAKPSIRNSRPTTPRRVAAVSSGRRRPRLRVPAAARHGRGALRAGGRPRAHATSLPHLRAGRRPSRICSPISCGGCSRTAPTPPSSTGSPTRGADRRPDRRPGREMRRLGGEPHPRIPLPRDICCAERKNRAASICRSEMTLRASMARRSSKALAHALIAAPRVGGKRARRPCAIADPADRGASVGAGDRGRARRDRRRRWRCAARRTTPGIGAAASARAACLERAADLYESERAALMALSSARPARRSPMRSPRSARRSISAAITPPQARADFASRSRCRARPASATRLSLQGRGVFACIAPVELPARDLHRPGRGGAGGRQSVIAKPAEQTPLIAVRGRALAA